MFAFASSDAAFQPAMRRLLLLTLTLLAMLRGAVAHPSDVSQMRVKLARDHIDIRLTLNVLNLSRIVVVDTDHNLQITTAEIAKAVPVVVDFLHKNVLVTINDADADIGTFSRHEAMWPNPDAEPVSDRDASQRYVDFHFTKPWPTGVREVWIGFQIFGQLGPQHTVQAIYQQPGEHDEDVTFTQVEPEYLYDTGWTDETPITSVAAAPTTPTVKPSPLAAGLNQLAFVGLLLFAGGAFWLMRRRSP